MTIRQFKTSFVREIENSSSPTLDIDVLLCFFLNVDKTFILLNRDYEIPVDKLKLLEDAIVKRKSGLPIAYITGQKEFYGYNFFVTPDVLIPKPDTEILVERAIELLTKKIQENYERTLEVCDMCCGSGCIGLSVLLELEKKSKIPKNRLPNFTFVDISLPALKIAKKNADYHSEKSDNAFSCCERNRKIKFIQSNLFSAVHSDFDVILTNPPYIPASMARALLKDGRNEPLLALDGDINEDGSSASFEDGLEIARRIFVQSKQKIKPNGIILMETGEYNAHQASDFAQKNGYKTKIHLDLECQERVVEALY